jgi:hypothetical protein
MWQVQRRVPDPNGNSYTITSMLVGYFATHTDRSPVSIPYYTTQWLHFDMPRR